jgi:hypothetical protein
MISLDPLDVIGLACTLPALIPDIIESDDENNLINTIIFNISYCLSPRVVLSASESR